MTKSLAPLALLGTVATDSGTLWIGDVTVTKRATSLAAAIVTGHACVFPVPAGWYAPVFETDAGEDAVERLRVQHVPPVLPGCIDVPTGALVIVDPVWVDTFAGRRGEMTGEAVRDAARQAGRLVPVVHVADGFAFRAVSPGNVPVYLREPGYLVIGGDR